MLQVKKTRTKNPEKIVPLDQSNIIVKSGLLGAWFPIPGRDLINFANGHVAVNENTAIVTQDYDKSGRFATFDNTTGTGDCYGYALGDPEYLKITTEITIVARVKLRTIAGASGDGRIISKSINAFDTWGLIVEDTTRRVRFRINDASVISSILNAEQEYIITGRFKTGTNNKQILINGILDIDATQTTTIDTDGAVAIGNHTTSTSRGFRGDIYSIFVFDQFIEDDILQKLAANEFQILEPEVIFYPSDNGILTLTLSDIAHNNSIDNTILTQASNLSINEISHSKLIENISLSQQNNLLVAQVNHSKIINNIILSGGIVVNSILHDSIIEAVNLTQANTLTIGNSSKQNIINNLLLSQQNILNINSGIKTNNLENITFSFDFLISNVVHTILITSIDLSNKTIRIEGNKLNPDIYLELFDLDATLLLDKDNNPGVISYFTNTPTGGGIAPILWRGNNYFPMPFELKEVENKGDGTAPSRPNIAISNVNQFLLAAVLSLGDLIGMKVTRWRTFYKFTDQGITPNTLMHYPIEQWIVTKKVAHSKSGIQFEMSSPLDRPGLRLPRKQILRDSGDPAFPGVSRVRAR